jgi:hypothetical protein
MNQTQAVTSQPDLPSVSALAGNFGSPYYSRTLSTRFDYQLNAKNQIFARYSHDGNHGFGPSTSNAPLPSDWLRNTNWADQSVLGWTSVITSTAVNDFRFDYAYWQNRNLFPQSSDCPNCIGLGLPQVQMVGSSNFTVGNTSNATQGRDLRRFDFRDDFTWQKGSHRIRFGGAIDHEPGTGFWGFCDPACASVFSPEYIHSLPAILQLVFPNIPKVITSSADLLNLPMGGAQFGVGNSGQPPPYDLAQAKANNRYHFYGQDSWRVRPNLTVNFGLGWEFESTLVNRDLTKPAYLAPIYGSNLSASQNNYHNFEPALGFAWNVGHDNKTVIRGGAGIYYDTESLYRRLQERAAIGPVGNGRVLLTDSTFRNIFPGIFYINAATGAPVPVNVGDPLPYSQLTNLTLGQFLQIYNQQFAGVQAALAPVNPNDLSVRNIQLSKSAAQLYPLHYPTQRSYQTSIGVQREITGSMVLSVDYVRRLFVDTLIGEIDQNRYNRFINGVRTPVIPVCQGAQAADPNAECSTGPITFWTPGGRGTYDAILMRFDKRFSHRYQFTVSNALQWQHGLNTIYNLDNYFQSYGPQGPRDVLNASGTVDLKWGFSLGLISSTQTCGPITAVVPGVDLTGSGISNTPIPGIGVNGLNCGSDKSVLANAVSNWNSTYAGKKDARGTPMPALALPTDYSLGSPSSTIDMRLTKNFTYKDRYKLSMFAEMFNVLNIANVGGYSFNLDSASSAVQVFGQATQRTTQVFGSGGPRSLQLGARFSF